MEAFDFRFTLAESRESERTVLCLHGDLDIAAVDTLQARLDELRATGAPVALDLAEVQFMDSSGMACIAQAVREARRSSWDLSVGRELSAQVQRLLELADGDRLFWPSGH